MGSSVKYPAHFERVLDCRGMMLRIRMTGNWIKEATRQPQFTWKMAIRWWVCVRECVNYWLSDMWVWFVTCRSAISRQHIAPHRLHLHQLLTDDTTDLDSYEVSASRSYLGPVYLFCVFLVYFLLFVLNCQYQCKWLPGKTRLRNDLLCVKWDVKLYSLTHSFILQASYKLGYFLLVWAVLTFNCIAGYTSLCS